MICKYRDKQRWKECFKDYTPTYDPWGSGNARKMQMAIAKDGAQIFRWVRADTPSCIYECAYMKENEPCSVEGHVILNNQ